MSSYEELLAKVMSENVTLADWVKFRTYDESQSHSSYVEKFLAGEKPTEEEHQDFVRCNDNFAKAARHVVSKLSKEDICQDIVLVLALEETKHPEFFGDSI